MTSIELVLLKAKAEAHVFRQIALAAMRIFRELSPDIVLQFAEQVRAELHTDPATLSFPQERGAAVIEHAEAVLDDFLRQLSADQ